MRKILSFLALALAFTACQNEPVETISNSGLVEVTLHVDAPEMEITRGLDGDTQVGRNSALGAIDFFNDADWAKYDVRYIPPVSVLRLFYPRIMRALHTSDLVKPKPTPTDTRLHATVNILST